jgi:hypothetical protein
VIQHHPYSSGSDFRDEFVLRLAHNGSILFGSWSPWLTWGGSQDHPAPPLDASTKRSLTLTADGPDTPLHSTPIGLK